MWVNILGIIAFFSAAVGLATKYLGLDVDSSLWVLVPLGIAGVLGLLWLILNANNIIRVATSRSARYGVNLFALSVIVAFVVVMANVILTSKRVQWDTTQNRRYSLAPQSLQVVQALDEDVMVTALARGELAADNDIFTAVFERQMELYRAASGRVNYQVVNGRRNPELIRDLPNPMEGNIYVTMGEKTVQVETFREASDLEEKITRAIIEVTRDEPKGAYIVTRRGEAVFTPDQQTGFGLGELKAGLEDEQFTVQTIDLVQTPEVPQDCKVLIIADPAYNFTDTDLAALTAYINRGGQVFACVDIESLVDGQADSTLVDYLRQFGIEIGKDVIIEQSATLSLQRGIVNQVAVGFDAANRSTTSEITKDLIQPVTFLLARSVTAAATLPPGVDAEQLFAASENSWAESDLERFRQGQVSPGDDPILMSAPVAQIFTVDVNECPAVFESMLSPGLAPTRTMTVTPASPEAASPEAATPATEPVAPMPVSTTPPEMAPSMDETPAPGGATDEGRDPLPELDMESSDGATAAPASPESAPSAHIVVVGDTSFMVDELMVPGRTGNRDFVLNAMNYLAADTDLIAIRPRDTLNTGFELSPLQARLLLVILIAMPVLTGMAGVIVAVRRRRVA